MSALFSPCPLIGALVFIHALAGLEYCGFCLAGIVYVVWAALLMLNGEVMCAYPNS